MTKVFTLRNNLDEEFRNESDRGCAILTLCLLEEALASLFAAFIPGGERDARQFMPKGRLSAGIANAHKLGLISDSMSYNFRILVEIRNSFAHGILNGLTFETPGILEKVKKLGIPNLESVPDVLVAIENSPRERFMMAVDHLFFSLEWMIGRITRLPLQKLPDWKVTRVGAPITQA